MRSLCPHDIPRKCKNLNPKIYPKPNHASRDPQIKYETAVNKLVVVGLGSKADLQQQSYSGGNLGCPTPSSVPDTDLIMRTPVCHNMLRVLCSVFLD